MSRRKKLSALQKQVLCILARQAYDKHGLANDHDADIDTWRAEQAIAACGRRISDAWNDDFNLLKAHFYNLMGNTGAAFQAAMRSGNEEQRRARHNLEAACFRNGLDERYADKICLDQFRCTLDDATPDQLQKLMFTVNNRSRVPQRPRGGAVQANPVTNEWEAHAEEA